MTESILFISGFLLGIAFVVAALYLFIFIANKFDYKNKEDLTKEEWRLR